MTSSLQMITFLNLLINSTFYIVTKVYVALLVFPKPKLLVTNTLQDDSPNMERTCWLERIA